MDFRENFESHCTEQEARELSQFVTLDVAIDAYKCYCYAYKEENSDDTKWNIYMALCAVYMMGFLTGCRNIRKRKKEKRGQA
jgi:hypothetical protein